MPYDFSKKAGEILRSSKPIEERLREFSGELSAWMGGGTVSVLLFDRESEDFYVRTSTLRVTPGVPEFHFPAEGTLEELSLTERRPIVLSERKRPENSRRRGTVLMFPLLSSGEPNGVLVVQTVTGEEITEEKLSVVTDAAVLLSHEIAREIEDQLENPGQIKVTVIRESRATDVASNKLDVRRDAAAPQIDAA